MVLPFRAWAQTRAGVFAGRIMPGIPAWSPGARSTAQLFRKRQAATEPSDRAAPAARPARQADIFGLPAGTGWLLFIAFALCVEGAKRVM